MSFNDSNKSKINNCGGIGFVGGPTLLFIGLKLTGYIDWSWWWVLAPMWISWAFVAVVVVFMVIAMVCENTHTRRR